MCETLVSRIKNYPGKKLSPTNFQVKMYFMCKPIKTLKKS